MNHELEEFEDWQKHRWTRREIAKINRRMRAMRRKIWFASHREELLIAGFVALGIAAAAFALLVKVN